LTEKRAHVRTLGHAIPRRVVKMGGGPYGGPATAYPAGPLGPGGPPGGPGMPIPIYGAPPSVAYASAINLRPVTGTQSSAGIKKRNDDFLKTLLKQEEDGMKALAAQRKEQRAYLKEQAEQSKKEYIKQVDQDVQARDKILTEQHKQQLATLNQQHTAQKQALEQQATMMTTEFQERKAEEEALEKKYIEQAEKFEKQQIYAATLAGYPSLPMAFVPPVPIGSPFPTFGGAVGLAPPGVSLDPVPSYGDFY